MRVVRSIADIDRETNSVVTVGTFDGVHRAHREIIREVVNRARVREGRSVVVTFDPHPKEVVTSAKGPVRLLTTMDERLRLLDELGIDVVLVIPFTREFSQLGSRAFYEQYVVRGIGVSEVVVGYDHMFGRNREAGINELVHLGKALDFSVFAVHAVTVDGDYVSSTRIRRALAAGDIALATRLLGAHYMLSGTVVRGDGRGVTLGFPTANIRPASEGKLIPARGVYLASAEAAGATRYGMLNIGVRPTLTDGSRETVEIHLFEFSGNLVGETITIRFLKRLRDERRFGSVEELKAQLRLDREASLRSIAEFAKT